MPEDRVGPKRATSPFVKGVSELEVRPWRTSAQEPLDRRRRELYKLAAPVFREHGYRGATIKALAHACHLAPAGLYHYFASKAAFATYVVRQPHLDWRSVYVDPAIDPLRQLSGFLDLAILELPDFLLALTWPKSYSWRASCASVGRCSPRARPSSGATSRRCVRA